MATYSTLVTAPANADNLKVSIPSTVQNDEIWASSKGKTIEQNMATHFENVAKQLLWVANDMEEAKRLCKKSDMKSGYGKLADKFRAASQKIVQAKAALDSNYKADATESRLNALEKTIKDNNLKITDY